MKKCIIGIAGKLASGKDTVASMINYIILTGITKANYKDWILYKTSIDLQCKHKVIHFADNLKKCLSIIYNIDRSYFDSREHKDEYWYCFAERRFIKDKEANKYIKIDIFDLYGNTLSNILKTKANSPHVIRLRTLMQYFGTDVCRELLGENIWINSTIYKAADIADKYNLCIIPDVRYDNEAKALVNHSLYGGLIEIKRDECDKTKHSSENFDFIAEYTIDNNGTLMTLFYQVLNIIQQINDK